MKVRRSFISLFLAFGLLVAIGIAPVSAQPNAPVNVGFDKTAVDPSNPGVWLGTVDGDIEGDLETLLLDLRIAGPIWHVEFDFIIDADDPDLSFTTRLNGILNTNTGRVVMNGTVTDGYLEGARVHEEGQLVDLDTLQFQGLIRIMPATAR
jgi:hypothetical protein